MARMKPPPADRQEPQAVSWRPVDVPKGQLAKPETIDAVRARGIKDWEGTNWAAIYWKLREYERTPEEIAEMTEFDVRMVFGVRVLILPSNLPFTNVPTTVSLGEPATIQVRVITRPKPKREPKELSIPVFLSVACEIFGFSDNRYLYKAIESGQIAARYHGERKIELDLQEVAARDPARAIELVPHSG